MDLAQENDFIRNEGGDMKMHVGCLLFYNCCICVQQQTCAEL